MGNTGQRSELIRFIGKLLNDGSCFFSVTVFGMCDISNDSTAVFAFAYERESCLDLRKHGTCGELSFIHVCLSFFGRDSTEISFFVSVLVEADFFDAGEDQKSIRIQLFGKKTACKILFNDGACTVKIDALLHNRNSSAACCKNLVSDKS